MIDAIIYGLLSALLWGTADFISRIPSRRIGYYLTSGYVQIFGFVGLAIYGILLRQVNLSLVASNWQLFLFNLSIGILTFANLFFLYRGYATGVMSVVAPIASANPMITIFFSIILLGEILSTVEIFGIVIIMTGIILTGVKVSELRSHKTQSLTKGVDSAVFALIALGSVYFGLKLVSGKFGYIFPITIMRAGAAITAFGLLTPLRQKFRLPDRKTLIWLIQLSALDTAGFITFNLGILSTGASLSLVATLSGLFSVVTIILAGLFYHEKLKGMQLFGVVLLLFGVIVILYY